MGLDMSFYGRKYHVLHGKGGREIELAYWRKNWSLHRLIINTYAGGRDDNQRIDFSLGQLEDLIQRVRDGYLPLENRNGESEEETIKKLQKVLAWAEEKDNSNYRLIYYIGGW